MGSSPASSERLQYDDDDETDVEGDWGFDDEELEITDTEDDYRLRRLSSSSLIIHHVHVHKFEPTRHSS